MAEKKKQKTEHEYVIPLREKIRPAPRYKKTNKALKTIKEFVARHMKVYDRDLDKIKVDKYVNEFIWARGIKNPPHSVRVKAKKDSEGIVRVELVNYPDKLKYKKLREEKLKKEALEKVESKKSLKEKMQETIKGRKGKEEISEDKNADGIDDKSEIKEKEETSKAAEEKLEEDMAKKEKHTTKAKSGKEKLAEKKEYDQRSQHK